MNFAIGQSGASVRSAGGWTMLALAVWLLGPAPPAAAQASSVEADVIDPIIVLLQRNIARKYGFNVLSAPEDGAAEIGKVYYVTSPTCSATLIQMAEQGTPMQIFEAMDLPSSGVPASLPRTQWVHVRLASALGKQARADLVAQFPGRKAEIGLALEALDQSNAQMFFGSRSVGSVAIKRAMEQELRSQSIARASDLGNQAVGAVAPHAVLVLQKFEFDRQAVGRKRAGLMINSLEMFGARIAGGKDLSTGYGYTLPTYSTLGFKPVTALFDEAACDAK